MTKPIGDYIPLYGSNITVKGNPDQVQGTLCINRDLLHLVDKLDPLGRAELAKARNRARRNMETWDVPELMCSCPDHQGSASCRSTPSPTTARAHRGTMSTAAAAAVGSTRRGIASASGVRSKAIGRQPRGRDNFTTEFRYRAS